MPITQIQLNAENQVYLDEMLAALAPDFVRGGYYTDGYNIYHNTRGIISVPEIVHYHLAKKMEEAGYSLTAILPVKVMNVNGYCRYLYRAYTKGVH